MKTVTFLILLFTISSHAQYPVTSTTSLTNADIDPKFGSIGNYGQDTNNDRDQYVGIWQYSANGIVFQVKIEKTDMMLNKAEYNGNLGFYNYVDVVIFKYKLIKNGQVVFDNLNKVAYPIDSFVPRALQKGMRNYLYGHFLDVTRNVAGLVKVTKVSNNPEKLKFEIFNNDAYRMNEDSYYDDGQPQFTVPIGEIEMVKIN